MNQRILQAMAVLLTCGGAHAQVNSGSNGSDGAFQPTTNTVINMADHPDGIYQYTSVNIPTNVTVTFIPNANNTPVVWLVQGSATIAGSVNLNGQVQKNGMGAAGGPGGYRGGNGGNNPTAGLGPGGGAGSTSYNTSGGSYGALGYYGSSTYGSDFLLPLIGGSGGGGTFAFGNSIGGGGGGGAFLIAATNVDLTGSITAIGGLGPPFSGGGSGGGIRICATRFQGNGSISAAGGYGGGTSGGGPICYGGSGRVRIDCLDYQFGGSYGSSPFTTGYQPIIIQTTGQGAQLTVTSVGGVPVSASPSGQLATPDAVLSAQQNNPIPIVVHCSNIPLNTQITVSVKPANGAAVSATGVNSVSTLASSTATVLVNMPRGGGLIYATAATGN